MGTDPFRRLFNLAVELREETHIQHERWISGRGHPPSYVAYSYQWIQRLQLHLDAALNGAEQTGFSVEEVSRRINALAEPMRRLIHWQRDGMEGAPVSFLKALPEAWRRPESAYIAYHTEEMLKAMHAVRELRVRAERSAAAGAGSDPVEGKKAEGVDAGHNPAKGKHPERQRTKRGKRLLEKSNPLKLQIYNRIGREQRQPGERYADIVARLKSDRDYVEQVTAAGEKLNTGLVRKALAFFDYRARQARKNQDNRPA